MDVDPDQLREAVESQHGGKATVITAIPVNESFQGKPVWQGLVHVFALEGHPTATRAYAWSHAIEGTDRRKFYAVLHSGPVTSALEAVRAAIISGV